MTCYITGHLHITRELVLFSPHSTKLMLGCQDNGPKLLPSLLYNYLFPASKVSQSCKYAPCILYKCKYNINLLHNIEF